MVDSETIRILLIEDEPSFVELLREWLLATDISSGSSSVLERMEIHSCECISEARLLTQQERFDIILADLNLPDSVGLFTFESIRSLAPDTPIVILSGWEDESLAIKAVRGGAQDYLVKGRLDAHWLARAIRYALERHRLRQELLFVQEEEQRRRDQAALDRLSSVSGSAISAEMLGVWDLRKGLPDVFRRLSIQFGEVLEKAMQARTYKVAFNTKEETKALAEQLAHLRCGPRDAIDLYLSQFGPDSEGWHPLKRQAYNEEARLLVLELMGHLVSIYRPYALGAPTGATG